MVKADCRFNADYGCLTGKHLPAQPGLRAHCVLLLLFFFLSGCAGKQTDSADHSTPESSTAVTSTSGAGSVYNANSWRDIINDDCRAFFDGCNQCTRSPGAEMAACTRKACIRYDRPRCMDTSTPGQPRLSYRCDDREVIVIQSENVLSLWQPVTGERRDAAPTTASSLKRVPAASGEKYRNDTMVFWSKGREAMWSFGDTTLKCQLQ